MGRDDPEVPRDHEVTRFKITELCPKNKIVKYYKKFAITLKKNPKYWTMSFSFTSHRKIRPMLSIMKSIISSSADKYGKVQQFSKGQSLIQELEFPKID